MASMPKSLIELHKQRADGANGNEAVAHWIAVIHAGRRLAARTVECVGGSLSAARATVVFADALRTAPPPSGCLTPRRS